jgi:hypothetical protein
VKYQADYLGKNPKGGLVEPNYAKLPTWLLESMDGDPEAKSELERRSTKKFFPNATNSDMYKGGAGSGNFGHSGREGLVGGSGEGSGGPNRESKDGMRPHDWHSHLDEHDIVHAKTANQAVLALHAGFKVDFEQPRQVGTLLHKLAAEARAAKDKGDTAPHIDLCGVSVAGTNAFCAGNLGVPRLKMPQMTSTNPRPGSQADDLPRKSNGEVDASGLYKDWLASKGYRVDEGTPDKPLTENAAMLHATQREIDGSKVGGMMEHWDQKLAHPIFVSSDNYILDGHHSWAAQAGLQYDTGKTVNVPIARVNANIFELLDTAWTFADEVGIPPSGFGKFF